MLRILLVFSRGASSGLFAFKQPTKRPKMVNGRKVPKKLLLTDHTKMFKAQTLLNSKFCIRKSEGWNPKVQSKTTCLARYILRCPFLNLLEC